MRDKSDFDTGFNVKYFSYLFGPDFTAINASFVQENVGSCFVSKDKWEVI